MDPLTTHQQDTDVGLCTTVFSVTFFYILQTNLQFLFSYISTVVGLMTKSN